MDNLKDIQIEILSSTIGNMYKEIAGLKAKVMILEEEKKQKEKKWEVIADGN